MYHIQPYGQSDINTAKASINGSSVTDLQEALEADKKVLKLILRDTFSYNSYIQDSLTEFTDDLINGEYLIGNDDKFGDLLETEIDKIYNPEFELTSTEAEAFHEFEALEKKRDFDDLDDLDGTDVMTPAEEADLDGTAVMTSAEEAEFDDPLDETKVITDEEGLLIEKHGEDCFQKYLAIKSLKETKNQSAETKTLEKAILLNYFSNALRKNQIIKSASPEIKALETSSGSWNYAADSFTGYHTMGVNSDSFSESKRSKSLLGVVTDGVTHCMSDQEKNGRPTTVVLDFDLETTQSNTRKFGGHSLAKVFSQALANFNFDKVAVQKEIGAQEQFPEQQMEFLNKSLNIIENIQKDKSFKFDSNSDDGLIEQYIEHLKSDSKDHSKLIGELENPSNKMVLTAVAPIVMTHLEIATQLKTVYQGVKEDIAMSSTFNYSLELGDKIVLVQGGDAASDCYDKDGVKLVAENTLESIYNYGFEIETEKFNSVLYKRADQEAELHSLIPTNTTVRIFNKEDVDKVVQVSDGAVEDSNTKLLPEVLKGTTQEVFTHLAKTIPHNEKGKPDYDDKTIMVFQKAS